jgi:pilus assembly protein Flp/PilA
MEFIVTRSISMARLSVARLHAAVTWATRTAPELGQSMVEYAIIAALVAVVALGAVTALGRSVNNTFSNVASSVETANSGGRP